MTYIQIDNQNITAAEALKLLADYQMLPLLSREIIIEKAIAGIELSLEEITNAIKQFYSKNQITTPEAKVAILQRYCITEAQLETVATKELRIEKFKQATWGAKLESYFLQCKPQLDKVIYSLLRTTEMEVAQELYFRIKAGEETFVNCAKQYSQGAEAQTGGLLGPVPLSQPHPAVAQKLAISQPGQLWMPMKVDIWYVIIRLEKLVAAQHDDATRAMLLNHLFEQWLLEQLQQTQISLCEEERDIEENCSALLNNGMIEADAGTDRRGEAVTSVDENSKIVPQLCNAENSSDRPNSVTISLPYSFESPVLIAQ